MTDQEKWTDAVMVVRREYGELGGTVRNALSGMTDELRQEKREFHSLTAHMGAESYCAECMGACCRTGKYHFSVLDLLVFLSSGEDIVKPSFEGDCCPYMDDDGCQMEPSLRPFPCITFHCEELYNLLAPETAEQLSVLENKLRNRCALIEVLLGNPVMKSLFMAFERYLREPAVGIISQRT